MAEEDFDDFDDSEEPLEPEEPEPDPDPELEQAFNTLIDPTELAKMVLPVIRLLPEVARADEPAVIPGIPVRKDWTMVDQIQPPLSASDADQLARQAERTILAKSPGFANLDAVDRAAAADLLVSLGEVGRLESRRLAPILKAVMAHTAYLGPVSIEESPRMRWYQNELVWSRTRVDGNRAEFFVAPMGHLSPQLGKPLAYSDANVPAPKSLGKDIQFMAKRFSIYPVNPADFETFESLIQDLEISEYIDGVASGAAWRVTRPSRREYVTAFKGIPEPERKKAAKLAVPVRDLLSNSPHIDLVPKQTELKNRTLHWMVRTVGTNLADQMELYGVLVGNLMWDERKDGTA